MEKQHEVQLFNRFLAGDEAAGQEIIQMNSYIVSAYVAKITKGGAFKTIREDLNQSGIEGLIVARNRFNPNRSTDFSTYAFYWIRKYVLDAIYRETNFYSTHELMSGVNTAREDDERQISLEENFGYDDYSTEYAIFWSDLEKILTPSEFYICNLIEQGFTMEAIGKSRGVSRQRIHQLLNRARTKINQEII